jgi:uncharacterized protein (DUF1697 family)
MATWVALLRAVNLGSHNQVSMPALRAALEADGYEGVATVIASGNLVFECTKPSAAAIEQLIVRELGVTTTVILRSAAQIRKLARLRHFDEESYVAFTAKRPPPVDGCVLVGADLVFPRTSELTGAVLEKRLEIQVTVRNWRTVEKLAQLVA